MRKIILGTESSDFRKVKFWMFAVIHPSYVEFDSGLVCFYTPVVRGHVCWSPHSL